MKRRNFIQLSIGMAGIGEWLISCSADKKIKGRIVGAAASAGHLLRDKKFSSPVKTIKKKIVIVGGGVSGLSAARHLSQNNINDFILLDLENQTGGNAAWGQNDLSAYPWGAHYIPIPNNDLKEYISFLKECNIITGEDANGLPVYNELYLCFDPQERLYINGRWQDGLIPHFGVPDAEVKQIASFMQVMDHCRNLKGLDGRDAFAIPVDNSSKDEFFTSMDKMTMTEWMEGNGYTSDYLHRYVNYCCRDDFGTPHHLISAWTAIHYFASRKGKAANAAHGDVLTWPEGNGFLVQQLQKNFTDRISTRSLATKIYTTDTGVTVEYLDVAKNSLMAIAAEQCIVAVPQFVACRLLNDEERSRTVKAHLHYVPWMVANLLVSSLEERSGASMSWDNVIHESNSLGYVEATHELLQQNTVKKNLTYYLPLTDRSPEEERKIAQQKTHEEWMNMIIADLQKIHPNIRQTLEEVNIMVWGHALIK